MLKDEQYARIGLSVIDFKNKMEQMRTSKKYSQEYLMKMAIEFKSALENDLTSFYEQKTNELNSKRVEVEKKYEQKSYADPTAELLRRQDIDRKIALMDDMALQEEVNKFIEEKTADTYYLDRLQLTLKEEGHTQLLSQVRAYRNAYNIDTPWMLEEEWKNATEELITLSQVKNTGYLWIGHDDNRQVVNIKDI